MPRDPKNADVNADSVADAAAAADAAEESEELRDATYESFGEQGLGAPTYATTHWRTGVSGWDDLGAPAAPGEPAARPSETRKNDEDEAERDDHDRGPR